MSCNHNQNLENAYKLIDSAYQSGANAVKLQTYTPETITMDSNNPIFEIVLKIAYGKEILYINYTQQHIHHGIWHLELKNMLTHWG